MSINLTDVIAMSTFKAKEYGIYVTDEYTFVDNEARDTYFGVTENYAELNSKNKILVNDSNMIMVYTGELSSAYDGDNFSSIIGNANKIISPDGTKGVVTTDTETTVTGNFTVDGATVATGSSSKVIKLTNNSLRSKDITIGGIVFMLSNSGWSGNARVTVEAETSDISNVMMFVRKSTDLGVTYTAEYDTTNIVVGTEAYTSSNLGIDSYYDILEIDLFSGYPDDTLAEYWKVRVMSAGWDTLTMAVMYMEE